LRHSQLNAITFLNAKLGLYTGQLGNKTDLDGLLSYAAHKAKG
jgi:hypothetical protein